MSNAVIEEQAESVGLYRLYRAQEGEIVSGSLKVTAKCHALSERETAELEEALNDPERPLVTFFKAAPYSHFNGIVRVRRVSPTDPARHETSFVFVQYRTESAVAPAPEPEPQATAREVVEERASPAPTPAPAPTPEPEPVSEPVQEAAVSADSAPEPEAAAKTPAERTPGAPRPAPAKAPPGTRVDPETDTDTDHSRGVKRSPSFTVLENDRLRAMHALLRDEHPTGVNAMLRRWILQRLVLEEAKIATKAIPDLEDNND